MLGLQIVLLPAYVPGLVRFLQDAAELAKPLLEAKFPDMPFEDAETSLAVTVGGASLILPIDQAEVAFASAEPVMGKTGKGESCKCHNE